MSSSPSTTPAQGRALLAGLVAGTAAAVVASLVSLPLPSPDDAFFNSASTTLAALAAGLAGGAVWRAVQNRPRPRRTFAGLMLVALVVVSVVVLIVDAVPSVPVDGLARFTVPLAAITLGLVAALTPLLARLTPKPALTAPAAGAAALALGIALAGHGSGTTGRLALPATTPDAGGAATSTDGAVLHPQDVAGAVFTIVPGESTATYTVHEKLARLPLPSEAVGKTGEVSGAIRLDGQPSHVMVDLSKLESDQPRRDNYIRTNPNGPNLNRYPMAEFTVADLGELPADYRPGDTVTRNVTGTMKIHEVERPVTFAVEARLQDNTLYVHGTTDLTWEDFNIPPPNIANFVQVQDTIHVEVLLVGRRGSPQ